MYLTEKEIFEQYSALEKTYDYFIGQSERIHNFFQTHKRKSLCFIGCGSSYFQCRSAELSARLRLEIPASSIPAGDLLINFESYKNLLKDSIIIAPSRSGETGEVLLSVKKAKQEMGCPIVCICCRENSSLSRMADLNLEIPWAFDKSVCQTRSVTNLYTANLLLIASIARDKKLTAEIKSAIRSGEKFQSRYKTMLKQIAKKKWDQAVILADSELEGIASAGALSIKEIALMPSFYYHLLDVRHGPILLIERKTLVIMVCSTSGISYQKDLLEDLKKRAEIIVAVSSCGKNFQSADYHISVPAFKNLGALGVLFIFIPQAIAFYKALEKGLNPDTAQGLAPWIILKEKK